MAIAETSSTRLSYILQSTAGVIPTSPVWKNLRYASEDIMHTVTKEPSDEIEPSANVMTIDDLGGRSVGGNINGFMSYSTYDDFIEALFGGTWTTNVVKNGITPRIFAFEKTFEQGATDSYIRYLNCRIGSMTLDLTANGRIGVSFGIRGTGSPTPTTAIVSGATYTVANTNPIINAGAHVGALTMSGITSPKIKSLKLEITRNLYDIDGITSSDLLDIGQGKFEVKGEAEIYFENLEVYNAIRANDDVALSTTFGVATSNKYTIALPKVKFMNGSPTVPGNSQSVMMSVPFQASYDGTLVATASVTRAVA